MTSPDGTTVTTATNVPSDVTSITVPGGAAGRVHQFANMPAARMATETAPSVTGQEDPATRTSTVAWREDHATTQVQRPGGAAYDYTYHDTSSGGPDGALRTETLPDVLGAGARPTVSYAYRPATTTPSSGNAALSSVEHSDGVRLSYEYDGPARRGETLSVLEGSTWTERGHVTRDPDDDLRVGTLRIGAGDVANDVVVPMSYDADGVSTQVEPMALTNDAATGVLLGTSAGVVTTAQRYTAFGELSALRSTRGMTAGLTFDYRYDPLGRLKVVTESDGGSTLRGRHVRHVGLHPYGSHDTGRSQRARRSPGGPTAAAYPICARDAVYSAACTT